MNFYRCLICCDVYMGQEKPSNCPYCGAKDRYLVNASEWVDENSGINTLSELSKRNLEEALQLEINNTPFYRDAMSKSRDIELQSVFKYLSKIEAEHASTIRKILKCELPIPEKGREVAKDNDIENLKAAHIREKAAAAFYKKAAVDAAEPRVKKVFTALSEIESDHVTLEEKLLKER